MTKQEILEKAETLLMQQKTYDLALGFLARHCGIGKAKLYAIFGNKDELIQSFVAFFCEKEKVKMNRKIAGKQGEEMLNCFFEQFFIILEKFPYLTYQTFIKKSWNSRKHFEDFAHHFKKIYKEIIYDKVPILEDREILAEMLMVQMTYYYSNLWKINGLGIQENWKNQITRCFTFSNRS